MTKKNEPPAVLSGTNSVEIVKRKFVDPGSFVSRDEYLKLLAHCPTQEWRTLLAFVRYGGLRSQCEAARVHWSNILWEKNRFHVETLKLGGVGRYVPIFPEIKLELQKLRETGDGSGQMFAEFSKTRHFNLNTRLNEIARGAGIELARRPFDNMRASRFAEIYEKFGYLCACYWLGINACSQDKEESLLQFLEDEFQRAAAWNGE